jgi:hypothetical protein
MSNYQMLLRYAIVLNNIGVTLLRRGSCNDSVATIKHANEIIKFILTVGMDNLTTVSNDIMARVVTAYDMGVIRLDPTKTHPNSTLQSVTNHHVHVIVLHDNVISTITNMESVAPKDSIFPILLEYSNFDAVDLDFILSIQLYNFALIHYFQAKYDNIVTPMSKTTTTSNLSIAAKLIRCSYAVVPQCHVIGKNHHNFGLDTKMELQINFLILNSLIVILQEHNNNNNNNNGNNECARYRSQLAYITNLYKVFEQQTSLNFINTAPAA